jgi:hypothetical protein
MHLQCDRDYRLIGAIEHVHDFTVDQADDFAGLSRRLIQCYELKIHQNDRHNAIKITS